ncbi:hypothetical protein ES703_29683 [subsurface metagenome]
MAEVIGYRKTYRLRTAVPGRKCIEVTFPYEVVEKEARSKGLTIDEFLNRFQALAEYDNFEGVLYKFVEIPVKLSEEGDDGGK